VGAPSSFPQGQSTGVPAAAGDIIYQQGAPDYTMTTRKKLIEVALPLEAINREAAREKSIRHGHPSTLHLWWARRPLAACRAVLFAQLVDDPSSHPEQFPTVEAQERERQRLFRIIEDLVKWENSTNEQVLERARAEIRKSCGGSPPPVLDPFCGGGSIPLEAQRLGLEAHARDLNPVAVLITKALIEIPPKFAGRPPVHPLQDQRLVETEWHGARGLAEDVRYYGQWMCDEAAKRIGHLYPKVKLSKEHGGGEATVIAWLWARTVTCPNPACGARMPLVRSFVLSTKKGKQAWVEPVVDKRAKAVHFAVKMGEGHPQEGTVNRRGARCIVCDTPVPFDHVRIEGKAGRMSAQLMAIVAEGERARVYLPPSEEHEDIAAKAIPQNVPDTDLPEQALGFRVQLYGMTKHCDLFTPRQLVALTTFSALVGEARERVLTDACKAAMPDDGKGINEGGTGATAYADAVATYLAFSVDKVADRNSVITTWASNREHARNTFTRQAMPMTWDFAESNPCSDSSGNFFGGVETIHRILDTFASETRNKGQTKQLDAAATNSTTCLLVSTDPPYYDNVPYAALSDFFYVWLRRSLGKIYPDLCSTLLVPKRQELIADQFRHGSREIAQRFFEEGLGKTFNHIREVQHPAYPLSVYYAFKQAEADNEEDGDEGDSTSIVASTGWETMLVGLVRAGFTVVGTWPMRTELGRRIRGQKSNALASSIVLVCRSRLEDARPATRREFLAALKRELPEALRLLQHGNIAPVDLAQAAIGPGMAVFSRYAQVLEAGGTPMRVRTALALINQTLDEVLAEQEGEFDAGTRWALAWFEQFGMEAAPFGEAETLSKAKNTSVRGLEEAGILQATGGKVRLLKREELDGTWDPASDPRLTVWEVTQHLLRALEQDGEAGAAALLARVGTHGDAARDLAYRLYQICERQGRAQEALGYNSLVVAWPEIARFVAGRDNATVQTDLFA
jgi:putative DNA methylase